MRSLACDGRRENRLSRKLLHTQERDSPEARKKHRAFRQEVAKVSPVHLVFVDESGADTAVKEALRTAAARTVEAIYEAVGPALNDVTPRSPGVSPPLRA